MWTALRLIGAGAEFADVPGAVVLPVAKDVADDRLRASPALRPVLICLIAILRMPSACGAMLPVQPQAEAAREQADAEERQQNARDAAPRGEHGDDLIAARHAAEGEKQREQEADGQRERGWWRELGEVKPRDLFEGGVGLDEVVVVVAEVDDQPDRDEARRNR